MASPSASRHSRADTLSQLVCDQMEVDVDDFATYPWVAVNYYPKPGEKKLDGAVRVERCLHLN